MILEEWKRQEVEGLVGTVGEDFVCEEFVCRGRGGWKVVAV